MFRNYGLYCAWVLVTLGTLGSLFFSEILNYEPCHLCWYQRLALFPLVWILGIGAYRGDTKTIFYALPLVVLGLFFAGYQILIQQMPGWNPIELCGSGPNCAEKIDIGLSFITIPMLSFANFLIITCLLLPFSIKRLIQ